MKAEERAILCCLWSGKEAHDITDGSHEPCDFCKHIAQHIREAEQQARKEAFNAITRDALGCIDTERGVVCDNLAIVLASHFEHHMDRPEDDEDNPETGWGDWVIQKTDESLDHITSKIRALIEREAE